MKRILLFLLMVILSTVLILQYEIQKKENDMVEFEVGNYHDKDWSKTIGTYRKAVVPNKETALEIAKAIFDGMDKSKEAREYIPQSVFYDEQDEIWIVSFWKESNEITLGGDCSIAIQKADGKVLRIWFGE